MKYRSSVFESKTYKEFKAIRGDCWSSFIRIGPTQKEIRQWKAAQEDLEDVQKILVFLNQNIRRAQNRGNDSQLVEVDLDYIYNVGAGQDFLCALTGTELEFTRGGNNWLGKWCNPNSCTIDRIDSSKGYVEGNIQLVTWKANCLKQHLNNKEFIDFCFDVYHWNK